MSFCSFSGEYEKEGVITVARPFVTEYLPEASGDAVRVYLYGLYACKSSAEITMEDFCKSLSLTPEQVEDCFKFWEEYDLVAIISDNPLQIRYLPISVQSKPRKFKPEKYSEFTSAIQALIPDRMISVSEYTAYFNLMEEYSIKPEAMLMICKYCVDLKGNDIGYRYITAVAKDFAYRGIITVELIEKELSDYMTRSSDISAILSALGLKRKPEIEDLQLFNKWCKQLGFEQKVLLHTAKKCKRKNIKALDDFVMELFSNKLFTEDEIDRYIKQKESYRETAKNICRNLSVYVEVIDTVVETYLSKWMAKGYDGDTLEFLASYCFKKNRRNLSDLDLLINSLYDKGLVTLSSIAEFIKNGAKIDEFIRSMLTACGLERRPTESDRNTLTVWQNWGFSDDMILHACTLATGASRPMVYVNAILSDWKTKGIFTKDNIPENTAPPQATNNNSKTQHFAAERNYSKDELDVLLSNLEDIKF